MGLIRKALTLSAAASAAAGTTTFTISGTSGGIPEASIQTVTVNAGSFTLSGAPSEIELYPGNSGKSTVSVVPINSFAGNVVLGVSGLPAGVTGYFSPAIATTASTLTLPASNTASPGPATLVITSTAGSLAASTSVSVNLLSAQTATATTLALTANGAAATTVSPATLITASATVTSGSHPLTAGQVYLCDATKTCDSTHRLATAQVTASGTATFRIVPGIGTRRYKAMFAGTTTYAASASAVSSLTVSGALVSTTTIAQIGTAGNYTLTATVAGQGDLAPTGTIAFNDASFASQPIATAPHRRILVRPRRRRLQPRWPSGHRHGRG